MQSFKGFRSTLVIKCDKLIKANQANGQDSCKNVEIFKNNATFLILTNMFPRYIHHCQCDGYESLNTAVKRA